MDYTSSSPVIVNYTLTEADTWYKIISAVPGVRKWLIRARETTSNAFSIDFTTTHDTYITTSGVGFAFDGCDMPDIYCSSSTAATVIELLYWR